LPGLTGIDDPYEPPTCPDVEITPEIEPDPACQAVLRELAVRVPGIGQRVERAAAARPAVLPMPHHGAIAGSARAAAAGIDD
jgi:hypothetical protein